VNKAVIFGTADFAQVAYAYLRDDSDYTVEAFTVDRQFMDNDTLLGLPVVAFEELVENHRPSDFAVFCAIGFSKVNASRRAVFEKCRAAGFQLPSYVHSSVHRWPETTIGNGCFIFENNVIQPFVTIGDNCVLWSGNHIGHHSTIGDNVFIASHAVISGKCSIGDNSFIGVNATFRDGITVAPNCVIGAGAIVLRDTIPDGVYKTVNTEAHERRSHELRNF
jgi:sugar O-acyltransferase (sialic acid O-acetyltransferase NeuD family)